MEYPGGPHRNPIISSKFRSDISVTWVGLSTSRNVMSTSGRLWLIPGIAIWANSVRLYQEMHSAVSGESAVKPAACIILEASAALYWYHCPFTAPVGYVSNNSGQGSGDCE